MDERHGVVLDVGCGTGLMAARLAAGGRRVVGLDIAAAMLAPQRRRAPRARFVLGDAEALPLRAGTFDAVVNLISVHHYPDPARAVGEFRRVLRPGGRLVLVAFDRASPYIRLAQRTNRWASRVAGTSWQTTPAEVLALVQGAGFTTVRVEPVRYWIRTFTVVAESATPPECP